MPIFRRLFFRCTNDEGSNLTMDVLMDDKRHWIERVPACGWWGRVDSNNLLPFILKSNNQLDFGSYLDEETGEATSYSERYGEADFADRILARNEHFTLNYDGDRYALILEKITDVASL